MRPYRCGGGCRGGRGDGAVSDGCRQTGGGNGPATAFPLAIIYASLAGYILPAINGFNLQLELLMTAKKPGKVDEAVLRAPYSFEKVE